MDTQTVVWIVVAVAVVLLLLVLVGFLLKRGGVKRHEERLARAEELRGQAAGHTADVQSAEQRARAAEVEAERARVQAQQAERVAVDAHRDLDHERAAQEDVVRRADELDPRVDTGADDYRPITGPDMKASTVEGAPPVPDDAARHRAD